MDTYKTLIETSFQNAENNISKITNDIINMEGIMEFMLLFYKNNPHFAGSKNIWKQTTFLNILNIGILN